MQLVSSKKSRDSRLSFHHDITEVMNQIAKFSKKFNVNFVIASQLSRSVEFRGGDPMLGDLKESGSIEQVADAVLFLKKKFNRYLEIHLNIYFVIYIVYFIVYLEV